MNNVSFFELVNTVASPQGNMPAKQSSEDFSKSLLLAVERLNKYKSSTKEEKNTIAVGKDNNANEANFSSSENMVNVDGNSWSVQPLYEAKEDLTDLDIMISLIESTLINEDIIEKMKNASPLKDEVEDELAKSGIIFESGQDYQEDNSQFDNFIVKQAEEYLIGKESAFSIPTAESYINHFEETLKLARNLIDDLSKEHSDLRKQLGVFGKIESDESSEHMFGLNLEENTNSKLQENISAELFVSQLAGISSDAKDDSAGSDEEIANSGSFDFDNNYIAEKREVFSDKVIGSVKKESVEDTDFSKADSDLSNVADADEMKTESDDIGSFFAENESENTFDKKIASAAYDSEIFENVKDVKYSPASDIKNETKQNTKNELYAKAEMTLEEDVNADNVSSDNKQEDRKDNSHDGGAGNAEKLLKTAALSEKPEVVDNNSDKESSEVKFSHIYDDSASEHVTKTDFKVQTSGDQKHMESVLRWESAKDAVNFAKLISQAGQNGVTKLTVRLLPEHLGRIEIQLSEFAGKVSAKIITSTDESKHLVASQSELIRQNLESKGIQIDNMEFVFHDSLSKQDSNDGREESERARRHRAKAANDKGGEENDKFEIDKSEGLYA